MDVRNITLEDVAAALGHSARSGDAEMRVFDNGMIAGLEMASVILAECERDGNNPYARLQKACEHLGAAY